MIDNVLKEKIYKLLDIYTTKDIAWLFSTYMLENKIKKFSRRRKDNKNSYLMDGKSTGWHRIECYYYKNSDVFGEEDLDITLRKESGYYLIIGRNGERAVERSGKDFIIYNEKLLKEIINDHKIFFDHLLNF